MNSRHRLGRRLDHSRRRLAHELPLRFGHRGLVPAVSLQQPRIHELLELIRRQLLRVEVVDVNEMLDPIEHAHLATNQLLTLRRSREVAIPLRRVAELAEPVQNPLAIEDQ